MMIQRFVSILALPLLLLCVPSIGSAQDEPAMSELSKQQMISFPDIQKTIVALTGYKPVAVELTTTGHQLVVTLVNSKFVSAQSTERESEASAIVSDVAKAIASKPEFKTVSSIPIDYVSRPARNEHSHLEDSIEFRRGMDGTFRHHVS
jgi:hypothetical protein